MDVDSGHQFHRIGSAHFARCSALLGVSEAKADGVEEERPRAAGGIEHLLFEWTFDGALRHLRRKPVGRVVFAEAMTLLAVDQQFVERLHHVALDLGEAKAAHMRHEALDQLFALRIGDDPVEEVTFDRAGDPRARELFAREQSRRIVLMDAEHGEGHAFGDHDEIGMLKPKRVALDVPPIDELEELSPELPFEQMRGNGLQPLPEGAELRLRPAEGDRLRPEFDTDRLGVGRQRNLECERAVEPGEKVARFVGVEGCFFEDNELAPIEANDAPEAPVRGDANERLAGLGLAVGEIVGHLSLDIGPFTQEIALGLEDRAADQGVGAALDLDALLEMNVRKRDVEFGDQEVAEIRLDLVMARFAGKVAQEFE